MKYLHNLILIAVIGVISVSCSSSKKAYNGDDAYYSATEHDKYSVKNTAPAASESTGERGTTNITNNYYYDDNDWYDWNSYRYSTRIRRFHRPAVRFGYYDPFFAAPYWYAPSPGWSITMSYGYGGYYPFYGAMPYPNYYYDPFFRPYYRPMYNPYMYSYNPYMGGGFYDSYYGGGGYYSPGWGGGGGGIGNPGGGTGVGNRTMNAPRPTMGGSVPDRNRGDIDKRPDRINRETVPTGNDVDARPSDNRTAPTRDGRTIDPERQGTAPDRSNNSNTVPAGTEPARENRNVTPREQENVSPREQEQNRGRYNRTDVFPEQNNEPTRIEPQRTEPQRNTTPQRTQPEREQPRQNDYRQSAPSRQPERNVEPRSTPQRTTPAPRQQNTQPQRSTPTPQRSTPQPRNTQPRQYSSPSSSPSSSPTYNRSSSPRSTPSNNSGGGRMNRPR